MILQSLTPSEEEIMQLIWNREKIYFRELMDIFPEPKPHQNTVSTFLKILVDKNYLTTEKEGRINIYSPTIDFDDYKKFVLKRFLENYFDNSGTALIKVLMEEKFIKLKDLNQFFEGKITNLPLAENNTNEKENHIQDFIKEITGDKKSKKKDKKKKNKSKKK